MRCFYPRPEDRKQPRSGKPGGAVDAKCLFRDDFPAGRLS
ncbi:hypothetical protein HMPREF3038_02073 [Akkermansia sp. KLE1797]|nr:hypothetical protein HMPREF3038_02073 [Akkermansia sp. KLE1797]